MFFVYKIVTHKKRKCAIKVVQFLGGTQKLMSRLLRFYSTLRQPSMASIAAQSEAAAPYMAVHDAAVKDSKEVYTDPATGYTVFTELSHLKRGYCCGNTCRHCPFAYENVGKPDRIKEQKKEAQALKKAALAAAASNS
ncbi:hypothetical protein BC829DRAFT_381998 [Chytridium lagenaria]|nr:hypothetical protein BC829DRAFT_381998 [Chytridium lagenaria]